MTGVDNVDSEARFRFGENWARFLRGLDEDRIASSEDGLRSLLKVATLEGRRFLDVGSGSGLSSLAAYRLGAEVVSFDYDEDSVRCTEQLQNLYAPGSGRWVNSRGSILDDRQIDALGRFDVVYSWGVLHHTGAMWKAISNAASAVAPGGILAIAIYNDQGWISRYWAWVKRLYNSGAIARWLVIVIHMPYLFALRFVLRWMTGRLKLERGMSIWHDFIDWVGGYPFEVASPGKIVDFLVDRRFSLMKITTCGARHGCNEFVFRNEAG